MSQLTEVLRALDPYVFVVGSHARGTARPDSDIDLTPRLRPDYDPGADRNDRRSQERMMPECIEILDGFGIDWNSEIIGYIDFRIEDELIEVCSWMAPLEHDIPFEVNAVVVAGVPMVALR
ncbi:MAG: nucleotidyltransferase domain-containing protein [Dermatophilaceae bacterium]